MIEILNRLGILLMGISGIVIAGAFFLFAVLAFALLIPGLFLYYTSIKMGFQKSFNNVNATEGEFDENGFKVINDENFKPEDKTKNNSFIKTAAKKIRNFCDRFAD